MNILGWTLILLGTAGSAVAGVITPEIDGASAGAAVALLSGGILVDRKSTRLNSSH